MYLTFDIKSYLTRLFLVCLNSLDQVGSTCNLEGVYLNQVEEGNEGVGS